MPLIHGYVTMIEPPLLDVRELSIGFSGMTEAAVRGLSLSVRARETLALIGESGCGKSLSALALMRLLPSGAEVRGGEVYFAGSELLSLPEWRVRALRGGGMGMIFQEPMTALNPVLTAGQQLAEVLQLHRPELADVAGEQARLLQAVGIPDSQRRLSSYPHQFSGGMKQRLLIAMALAGQPRLLIADEPTTALDVTIQAQVLHLIKELQQQTGVALLLITHDLGVVAETADRLAVMYAGEVIEEGPVAAFFTRPLHPYARHLLSAVPDARSRDRHLATIPGVVPPLGQVIHGCAFAPRCAQIQPQCTHLAPHWHEEGPQRVRCHLYAVETTAGSGGVTALSSRPLPERSLQAEHPVLRIDDLRVHFPLRQGLFSRHRSVLKAVDGVSLHLPAGRTLALVGESGCGKTSIAKALLRLYPLTGGRIEFAGQPWSELASGKLRARRRQMQIIFQDPFASMNPRMRVDQVLAEGLEALRPAWAQAAIHQRLSSLLEQVGLPQDSLQRYPHEFSGGQRQRLCIARALAVEPRLIICDEPTSALDVSVQAQILNLLKTLQQRHGMAYLFITHNLPVVAYLADVIAVMYLGRIVEQGPALRVLEHPQHPYTQALLAAAPGLRPAGRLPTAVRLAGDQPSATCQPSGCFFHPRCPEAQAECRQRYPVERLVAAAHQVACHRLPDPLCAG